jgi:hypothetical protein
VRAIASLAAAAALRAGCGTEDEVADTGAPPEAEPGVVDCGSYENRNEPPTSEQEEANQCLIEALGARRPARLAATLTTIEGDPVTHTFTVTPDGRVELVVDARQDAYGGGYQSFLCTKLSQQAGRLAWEGCTELETNEPPLTNPQQPS